MDQAQPTPTTVPALALTEREAKTLSRPVAIPCGAVVRFGPFDRIEDAQVGRLYVFRCHESNPNRLEVGMVMRLLGVNYIEVTCFNHSGGEWRVEQSVRRSTVLAEVVSLPDELRNRMVAACKAAAWKGEVEKACGLMAA